MSVNADGCAINQLDTDSDGVTDNLDQCPDTPANFEVDEEGCIKDTDNDGVYDFYDQCPNTEQGATVNNYGCTGYNDGLTGFYPFNGDADDDTENTINGIIMGANLTTNRYGNINSAYSFDGVSSYIEIPKSTSNDLFYDYSVAFWFRTTSSKEEHSVIWSRIDFEECENDFGNSIEFRVLGNNDGNKLELRWRGYNNNTIINQISPNAVNDGEWHHAAVVNIYNGYRYFFLDGEIISYYTGENNFVIAPSTGYSLGKSYFCDGNYFEGDIDEFRIYQRELLASEVNDLFNE